MKKVILPFAILILLNSKNLKSSDDPITFCPTCKEVMQLVGLYYICNTCNFQIPLADSSLEPNYESTKKEEELSSEACAFIPEVDKNEFDFDFDFTPFLAAPSDDDLAFMETLQMVQQPCFKFDANGLHLVEVEVFNLINFPGEYIINANNNSISIYLAMIIHNRDNIRVIIENKSYKLKFDQLQVIYAIFSNWNLKIYSRHSPPGLT